jgi:hypothetical protein
MSTSVHNITDKNYNLSHYRISNVVAAYYRQYSTHECLHHVSKSAVYPELSYLKILVINSGRHLKATTLKQGHIGKMKFYAPKNQKLFYKKYGTIVRKEMDSTLLGKPEKDRPKNSLEETSLHSQRSDRATKR